jgi:Mg-chelatase subunit ChlD
MVKKALFLLAIISVIVYCASTAKFLANPGNLTPVKSSSTNVLPVKDTTESSKPVTAGDDADADANELHSLPHLFMTREPIDGSRPRLDVVFAIDSTGSMGDEIEVVKQNIRNIINDISQATPTPDVRYGIVTYRDQGDEYITRKWKLTRDMAQIVTALNSLVAGGGGDKEEAVAEALHVSLQEINWDQQAHSKLVFLIGDAGPHLEGSRNNRNYQGSLVNWQAELKLAQRQGITINTIACSGIEAHEIAIFEQMSAKTNGSFDHLTYKQEVVRSDGSRAIRLEEAGRTYEVAADAAKDWERGATELVARKEATAIGASGASAMEGDIVAMPTTPAEPSFLGEIASRASRLLTPSASAPVVPATPPAVESVSVAEATKAKPADEARRNSSSGALAPMAAQPLEGKTNNLHSILAGSIKQAARKQGATYGTTITPLTTAAGTNSNVNSAQSVLIDNAAQLTEMLGKTAADAAHIDFNRQVVVAIFLGQVTASPKIIVNSISLNNKELNVRYHREVTAAKGNFTPYQLVVIPRQIDTTALTAKNIFLQVEEDK